MLRILPIIARIRARLSGNLSPADCASEIIELAPAVDRMQPAPIALPHEFDRVRAVQEQTTLAIELERLREGSRRHGPTIAYRIDNTVLAQGTLYFDGGYQVIRSPSAKPLLPHHPNYFDEMQLCTNYVIDRYFGHWLIDGLTLELLAEQRQLSALSLASDPWLHEPGYREIFGLGVSRTDHALIRRLWTIDDRGLNDNWVLRLKQLRNYVRSAAVLGGAKRVMLARGELGTKRNLVNSAQIYEALDRCGFQIIRPETETPKSLAAKLRDVEIAVTVEGSAQNHCFLAMPTSSTLLTIQPPNRFNAFGKTRADAVGINWAYVVGDPDHDGFRLPLERLLRTIDEVVRVSGARRSARAFEIVAAQ